MDYNNNVYNVDEADVQDLSEFSEPVEEVEATVMDNKRNEKTINGKGVLFSVLAIVLGANSALSVFWSDFSFIMCLLMAGTGGFFSIKYLLGGYHHKIFGKFAIIGFLLGIIGIVMGIIRLILACIASVGQAFLFALF